MLLSAEKVLFVQGPVPVLLIADAPVHEVLPVVAATDGTVPRCDGWGIVPQLTMCVVDGPGEAGFLIPAFGASVVDETGGVSAGTEAMVEWCQRVEQTGGAMVLSVEQLPGELDWGRLLGSGTARGGFAPVLV